MDEQNKFKNIIVNKPKNPKDLGDDPDAKRKEELKDADHKNSLWLRKFFRPLVVAMGMFLVVLYFVILPVSVMEFKNYNFWEVFGDWSRAFIITGRTTAIALATLVVSDLLKKLFDYIKKERNDSEG